MTTRGEETRGTGQGCPEELPLPTTHPEPHFSSSLSHNSISLESVLGLVKILPSCLRVQEASVK